MGTGYTVDGDSWYNTYFGKAGGQTFRVPEPTHLHYVTLYVKKPDPKEGTRISVFYADGAHEPMGDVLAVATFSSADFPPGVDEAWITKTLSRPIKAIPAEYYCILLESMTPWNNQGKWRYDAGDADYPPGRRISTDDNGVTWTQHPNDDHMFFIWGTPPAPPPPPVPPPGPWFPVALTQEDIPGGFNIVLITDAPCHLWLYWTDRPPWVHRTSKIERGLAIPWDAYWCFVVWHLIPQEEAGDTLIHTFNWTGWEVCQTKYFRFRGTRGGKTIASESPIFHKHYEYVPVEEIFEFYSPNTGTAAASTYRRRILVQTFTTDTPHKITKVELKLHRLLLPGQVTVDIYAVDASHYPTGPSLCHGTTDGNTLPTEGEPFEWREILLGAGADLAAEEYAIYLQAPTSERGNNVEWRIQEPGTYPRGIHYYGWTPPDWYSSTWDCFFREYGYKL